MRTFAECEWGIAEMNWQRPVPELGACSAHEAVGTSIPSFGAVLPRAAPKPRCFHAFALFGVAVVCASFSDWLKNAFAAPPAACRPKRILSTTRSNLALVNRTPVKKETNLRHCKRGEGRASGPFLGWATAIGDLIYKVNMTPIFLFFWSAEHDLSAPAANLTSFLPLLTCPIWR